MALKIRPLTEYFGAEAQSVAVSGRCDATIIEQIRSLWHEHKILLFRGQSPTEQDLVEFSRRFGALEIHVRTEYLSSANPELLLVSNMMQDGRPIGILSENEVGWHYDQIYLPRPALGSLLCAVKIPPAGGNTYFADTASAYEALPDATKKRIEGKRAVQSYEAFNNLYSVPTSKEQKKRTPDIDQPLVRTHPFTERKSLYLCAGMTTRIVGIPEDESRELLDELLEWIVRPEFVYCHEWRAGDCIIWDNACTIHRRDPFDSRHERLMKRTTILPPPKLAVPF